RLANGRYNILVRGDARVRIERELPTDTLYRLVSVKRLDDVGPATDVSLLLSRIREAAHALLDALGRPPDLLDTALAEGQPSGAVADRVAAAVLPDASLRQTLLETLDVDARVARVAHAIEMLVRELKGGRPSDARSPRSRSGCCWRVASPRHVHGRGWAYGSAIYPSRRWTSSRRNTASARASAS